VQKIGRKTVPAKDVFNAGRSTVSSPNSRVVLSDLEHRNLRWTRCAARREVESSSLAIVADSEHCRAHLQSTEKLRSLRLQAPQDVHLVYGHVLFCSVLTKLGTPSGAVYRLIWPT
jgi:hypothetical protein